MAWGLQFDGVDDYVSIPDSVGAAFEQSFTLVVAVGVVGVASVLSGTFYLAAKGAIATTGRCYGFEAKGYTHQLGMRRNTGSSTEYQRYIAGDFAFVDRPIYLTITYSGSTGEMQGYRNTEYLGNQTTSIGSIVYARSLGWNIGALRRTYPSSLYTKGQLFYWSLWAGVLTADEISAIINRQYDQVSIAPAAIYEMDEGSGNTVIDSSGNGRNGTIIGASWFWVDDPVPPGRVDISATLRGSSSFRIGEPERIRGLSATLKGSSLITAKPERIRGLSATLQGSSSVSARMNLIASLKAHLQGKATLKSTMLVLFIPSGVYVIDADEIFDRNQPMRSQSFANYIEVKVNPLKPVDVVEEVYKSSDPIDIAAGETKTISIQFKSKPVIEATARIENAPAGATISNVKYYAWGADVTITSPAAGTFDLIVDGKPLKVQGEETVVAKDEQSILENGIKKYTFDNPFVQDRATAETIGQHLLKFANPRSDITIDWRGDPAVVLADVTMIPEYQRGDIDQRGVYYITKQELNFDGGLRVQTEGRKM